MGKYFKTLDDLNGYMLTFSDRKEIPPRYLEISLIGSQSFNSLAKILDDQGLMNFVQIRDRYYPDLVGIAYNNDLVIMYAMVNEITINWTYFIVQHMLRFTKGKSSTGFVYVCLWSRIFNHLRIDLSEEVSKTLGNSGVIDIRTLHHKGRAMEDQGQEEEAPQAHQAPQAPQASHEPQAGPSQQPSMLDLMHVLQRIEQNQDRMDRQFQSVDRRLHWIEQYLEIKEDEDEDQD
ncbi:hypothetical protein PIB30_091063 [Stylosanthes scabra]|uniref:Uncharacterized protein n=1 Tax=Stylosanthes scabra TaxID=79078 RepID=A0ABU6QTU9_9FABA|nr:hypothetical protein [Stylosanthes scabra]